MRRGRARRGEGPVKKRLKQIADFLLEEIERNEHSPLEEFTVHKKTMIHILQFLNAEEAYAVSTLSARIYEWFQTEGVWRTLAQRWLSPERYTQCWQWAEKIKPKGTYINYLWLLLAEYASSGSGYLVVYYRPRALAFIFGRTLMYNGEHRDSPFNTYLQQVHPERRSEYGQFRLVYRTFVDYPEAIASFEHHHEPHIFQPYEPDNRIMIRDALATY